MVRVIKLGIKRPVVHDLLPDPDPREVYYTFISVDDHLMEPPHTFEGRLPGRLQGDSGDFGKMVALRGNDFVPVPLAEAVEKSRLVDPELYDLIHIFFG